MLNWYQGKHGCEGLTSLVSLDDRAIEVRSPAEAKEFFL
jgi:hypothetical protein